jgi:hypothetical protein
MHERWRRRTGPRRLWPSMPVRLVVSLAAVLLALAACGGAGGSAGSSPTTSPAPSVGPVTTPEQAVAAVIATEPRLTGIRPLDPDLIGQASWYEVTRASGVGAFLVEIRVGWGDCPAGCIDEHTWTYAVGPDGSVQLQSEGGDVVPPDAWPSPGGDGRTGLQITATAGPVCPVETEPPDPACAPRPVPGAVVVILDPAGTEVMAVALDETGSAFVKLPEGGYVVEAQPVEGLMGTAAPVSITVVSGIGTPVELGYDTGIR